MALSVERAPSPSAMQAPRNLSQNSTATLNEIPRAKPASWLQFDPRTKLALLIAINVVMVSGAPFETQLCAGAITAFLLASARQWRVLGGCAIFYLVMVSAHLINLVFPNPISLIIGVISSFAGRILVVIAAFIYLLHTTGASELIAALKRMHLPDWIIIPLAVMLRFFPTAKEEFYAIIDAMRIRHLLTGSLWLHPIKTIEYIFVPLLISTANLGEELAASAMLRGLGAPGNKTSLSAIGLRLTDLLGASFILILLTLWVASKFFLGK